MARVNIILANHQANHIQRIINIGAKSIYTRENTLVFKKKYIHIPKNNIIEIIYDIKLVVSFM